MGFYPNVDTFIDDLPAWPGPTPPKRMQLASAPEPLVIKGKKYRINGAEREMYTVGQLARILGRKAVTLRAWEDRGKLPLATFRSAPPQGGQLPGVVPRGRRLYSLEQVHLIQDALTLFQIDSNKPNWVGFTKHISDNWTTNT